jgi:hypothetical protein
MFRIGPSTLEQLHCGIDVSERMPIKPFSTGNNKKLDEILRRI